MPVVRVILREGQEKLYYEAQASIHTPDRTLRITRNQDSIAEFQSEYGSYQGKRIGELKAFLFQVIHGHRVG